MSDIVLKLRDGRWSEDRTRLDAAAEIERLCELVAFNEDQRRMLFDAACKWEAEAMAARKLMKDYWIEGVPWPAYYQSARATNRGADHE